MALLQKKQLPAIKINSFYKKYYIKDLKWSLTFQKILFCSLMTRAYRLYYTELLPNYKMT